MKKLTACTLDQLIEDPEDMFDVLFGGMCWGRMYNARLSELEDCMKDIEENEDDFTAAEKEFGYKVIRLMKENGIDIIIDLEGCR